ncbi:hypothetical protein ES708_19246 [subsurface metagenome]
MKSKLTPQNEITPSSSNSNINSPKGFCQAFSSLVKDNILERAQFTIFAHVIKHRPKTKLPYKNNYRKSPRGDISEFSKKSRFRLFVSLAKISFDLPNKPLFISCSYHYGHRLLFDDNKTHLHHFLISLRRYDPDVQYIWRLEHQKRGAPHFHLIIFPSIPPEFYKEKDYSIVISSLWHDIADPNSKAHKEYGCKVSKINNYRNACAYLSKYIAKLPEGRVGLKLGKHWGCSRNLPFCVRGTIESNRKKSIEIIEKIRKWLIENGKESLADPAYLNVDTSFTIFIDSDEFYKIIGSDKEPPETP